MAEYSTEGISGDFQSLLGWMFIILKREEQHQCDYAGRLWRHFSTVVFLFTKSALNRLRAHCMLWAVEPTRDSVAVFTKVFLRLTMYVCM